MNMQLLNEGGGWTGLLRPWTTPLEPDVWLRTWLGRRVTVERHPGQHEDDGVSRRAPSVTWNSQRFDADGEAHETILELLERNGRAPRFGCRRGVCRRCIVPLRSGRVRDMRDGRDIEAGTHVRICVSAPLGEVELDGVEQPGDNHVAKKEMAR